MLNKFKNSNKGITLIALVITIIVLIILAGVTIIAITGNESAPNKAVEARQKNDEGAELDSLKVAVVSSIVEGELDLNVDIDTLKTNIQGIVTDDLDNVIDLNSDEWTVTGNSGVKYKITNKGIVSVVNPAKLIKKGDTVTYVTSLNNKELTMNWKVFYKKVINGKSYTWLILEDYLPNSYVKNISGLTKVGSYAINSSSRSTVINAIKTKDNWNTLLTGVLNGKPIDYSQSTDTNVQAMGGMPIELWRDSWNETYPNTTEYPTNELNIRLTSSGYNVSRVNKFPNSSEYSVVMTGSQGYIDENNVDTMYFPHTSPWNDCIGSWMSSESAYYIDNMMCTSYIGVNRNNCTDAKCGFRPLICIPSSALE